MNPGLAAFKLSFNISPIILTGGVAGLIPGGMLPIISITQALDFAIGLLGTGGDDIDLDSFFCYFQPLSGSTFIDQQIGQYPFANQAVAANAVISQPLAISMEMICPVRQPFGYATKLATMTALQNTLAQHNASGGTYTVATPSRFYENCVMLRMVDTSGGSSKQTQERWRLDFVQPLLTLEQAAQAQNSLMGKLSSGVPIGGDPPAWSGLPPTVGAPPSLAGPGVVPALSGASGGSISGSLFGADGFTP